MDSLLGFDKRAQIANKSLFFLGKQRLINRFPDGWYFRVACHFHQPFPIAILRWLDFDLQFEMNLLEACLLCKPDQVSLIKVGHWVGVWRLNALEQGFHLLSNFHDRFHIITKKAPRRFREGKTIDRLEDRETPTRLEDPMEFLEGLPF